MPETGHNGFTVHRVCQHRTPNGEHECGRDSEHTDAHRCPCGEAWWQ